MFLGSPTGARKLRTLFDQIQQVMPRWRCDEALPRSSVHGDASWQIPAPSESWYLLDLAFLCGDSGLPRLSLLIDGSHLAVCAQ